MNDAEAPEPVAATVAPRARLFRKYAALFASLVAVALIASGAIEVWFSYQENKAALLRIQREKAEAAAAVIEQFVKEVEAQIGWTTHAAFAPGAESLAQRRVDYLRLLRQAPAITEIGYLDAQGREQVLVSRLAMDVVGSNKDLAADPKFSAARAQGRYLSAVYFRKESEPYLTFGLAGRGRDRGVTVAEVNLKFIWDVVSRIKVGREGHAYVVDAQGLLIAHPDISLVLRKTDLSSLLQVRAARAAPAGARASEPGMIADDHAGRPVLASSAAIAPVGWTVLVKSPLREAFAPIYNSMVRTGILLVVGIALSALAGLWLARRMVGPIQALASGAARIGAGELGRRIDIKTGDELEALADQFNRMGTRLQESYATLERRVEDRTRELSESLEQQTATSEVLRSIASSPGESERVLRTIAETAHRLFGATAADITRVDGGVFRRIANVGPTAQIVQDHMSDRPIEGTVAGRAVREKRTVQVDDFQARVHEFPGSPAVHSEAVVVRTIVSTPLLREGEAIGSLTVVFGEVCPLAAKQLELMESFADQAVIAIENARLLDELNARMRELSESLEQQTATSEVLRVIASSPGEAERILDTIARTAHRLFAAQGSTITRIDGAVFRSVAATGEPAEFLRTNIYERQISRDTAVGRAVLERRTIHIEDIRKQHSEFPGSILQQAGVRTLLVTPLMREGEPIGTIGVRRNEVRPFSAKEIELLESFAAQAVIAIENARLLDELQARTAELARSVDELKALGAVGQAVNSTLDLQKVLDTVLVNASTLSDAGGGAIYAYDEAKGEFELQATHGMPDDLLATIRGLRIRLGETAVGQCAARREAVQIPDLKIEGESYPLREALSKAGVRSLLAVPLLREDEIVGALVVRRKRAGEFAKETVDLLQAFASQSTLAIQNARLFLEIEQKSRELEIASQHKSQFLANMSHELRTPLNAILGYTELIVDEVYGATNDKVRGVLERVQANGRHLLGLINDVLDLSKIEAGQLTLSLADYSLGDVIQTVVTATEPLAAEKRLAVKLAVPKDLPHGLGDERRIAQVLLNLVGNAIKFTDAGEVAIAASATNGAFEVAVSDTGPGIPPGEQSKIFEEFHQVDSSSTRKKGGTGLGLSIARKIVEMHGGRIWVNSEVGRGSTFRFTLQVRCAEMAEAK